MKSARYVLVPGIALAFAAGMIGCNDSPTQPVMANSDITRLTIEGPISVPPGQTAKFYATAHLTGNAVRDVTDEVAWLSSAQSVLTVSKGGLATGQARGETELAAAFGGQRGTRAVVVLEDGTYRLAGMVVEPGPGALPVADAHVDVTGGTAAGRLSTVTTSDGRYALYGVAGPTEIRVTKNGYHPRVLNINVTEHLNQDVELPLSGPRADLSGMYTLTLNAASACAQVLPRSVRSRAYSARVLQRGTDVEVELSGAEFVVQSSGQGDGFRGRVDPGQVTFTVSGYSTYYYWYHYLPDVLEKLPSGFFSFDGNVVTGTKPPLSGQLSGSFLWFTHDPSNGGTPASSCQGDHQFVLARIGS